MSLAALFEEANEYLGRSDEDVAGILLIIDELGKFLEYGADQPEQGDVFVLQELAEAASPVEPALPSCSPSFTSRSTATPTT